ncbi:uncharacterized protein LOC125462393 isoform X2 [Stegostoma tigrinum]|uniref:uncharacterized protein LOC125462393 isoform X2 n=1 Tax=Stegostoma tigrinum TaxID=3053191 RepID=UPI00202B1C35|nr:uncharacterized protein LOC125462393 isoform X2 [Stegostoma tigrinum]
MKRLIMYLTNLRPYFNGTLNIHKYFISQKAQPIFKFSGYPDEIKHLGVNTDGKEHLTTHREAFFVKEVIPRRILNKTVAENRMKNTRGLAMKKITSPASGRASYCTAYSSVHGIRAYHPTSAHIAEFQPKRHTHNIITGEEGPNVQPTNYKRKSGDWLQQCSRQRGCFYDRFFLH